MSTHAYSQSVYPCNMKTAPPSGPGLSLRRRLLSGAVLAVGRRASLFVGLGLLSGPMPWVSDVQAQSETALPGAQAFSAWLQIRPPGRLAIVLMSLPNCGFCEIVRREQLSPLQRDATYADLDVFELGLQDSRQSLPAVGPLSQLQRSTAGSRSGDTDSSATLAPVDLAAAWQASRSPTLVFLGPQGMLAPPLVGYGGPDFYWSYLSGRIDQARTALAQGH